MKEYMEKMISYSNNAWTSLNLFNYKMKQTWTFNLAHEFEIKLNNWF